MRTICADYIFLPKEGFSKNKLLHISDDGTILSVEVRSDVLPVGTEFYPGALVPGFINTHCHLELSHLKGIMKTGTTLIPFLKSVVSLRETDGENIQQCIVDADMEMQHEGIVAVGDISNQRDTISVKSKSPIHYHSFIECFDFHQENSSADFFKNYEKVYDDFGNLSKSLAPHAPYSVSRKLFQLIRQTNPKGSLVSIHNQETVFEDAMFESLDPSFSNFFSEFGFDMSHFKSTGKKSVYFAMDNIDPSGNVLFIHNTMMKSTEVQHVMNWNRNSYFVTCPNANLFIENRLPDYQQFAESYDQMCMGTDSLSSNWQLSILEEIKTILTYYSTLPMQEVFNWATINGARALQLDHTYGSFEVEKKPGINWIQGITKNKDSITLTKDARVNKIM